MTDDTSENTKKVLAFVTSSAWDIRYGLPLVPVINNPWLYCAYGLKLFCGSKLKLDSRRDFKVKLRAYSDACRVDLGLFNRWPGNEGEGGITSHDELAGICYLSQNLAREVSIYLDDHFGEYNNTMEPSYPGRFNVYRIVWLRPFIKACSGQTLSLCQKIIWSAVITFDALTYNKTKSFDAGGRLRFWIQFEHMQEYKLCKKAIDFWVKRMPVTLEECLAVEPKEAPIYAELAKGRAWI